MLRTIKSRFIFFSLLLIILSTGIPIYILLQQFDKNFNERSVVLMDTTLELLRYSLKNAMMAGENKNVQKIVEEISNTNAVDHIRIYNNSGLIKYSSNSEEISSNINSISAHSLLRSTSGEKNIDVIYDEKTYSVTEPILNSNDCRSCHEGNVIAFLDVDSDLTPSENVFFTGFSHMFFVAIALIILLFVGFYLLFNYFINNPLQKLTLAFSSVVEGNENVKLPVTKNDEMTKVYNDFNVMTSRLKSSKEKIAELHQEQLQRMDRLKSLGELTSQVAHEINNHSAIIMSRADYLQLESSKENLLKPYQDDLEVIMDQTSKIASVTSNILRHSKKDEKVVSEIDLKNIVERCLQILSPSANKRNIRLIKDIGKGRFCIKGNSIQIEQVLINLINNAMDAIENEGEIKIELYNSDEQIYLTVRDNGKGMNEAEIENIFSPFYTTKGDEKGTGLGLYIVNNICKSHNAEIKCSSRLGEGTEFKIKFNKNCSEL